jgi:hypothetical protein
VLEGVLDCELDAKPLPLKPTIWTGKEEMLIVRVAVVAGADSTHVACPFFPSLHPSDAVAPFKTPNHATSEGPATYVTARAW